MKPIFLLLWLLAPVMVFAVAGNTSTNTATSAEAAVNAAGGAQMSAAEAVAKINAMNAAKGDENKEIEDVAKELTDFQGQAQQMMKQLEKVTSGLAPDGKQPTTIDFARQKIMRLASDDRFLNSAAALWKHPEREKMLLIQLGFFLFMILIKAWRLAQASHWFKRLVLSVFLNIITIAGMLYVIPLLVLGEPFAVFTTTLFRLVAFGGP